MKILVTGANGYIGKHVVKKLLDLGNEVIASDFRLDKVDDRAIKIIQNIFENDLSTLQDSVGKIDVCIHLAWRDGFIHNSQTHIEDLSNHYKFLTNIIDLGVERIAVMGTMHEVGYWEGAIDEKTPCNPISLYGIAKDTLRKSLAIYIQNKGCELQWLRAFYIMGDDLSNNSIFTKLLQANNDGKTEFPFTTGKNKYDFITVNELSEQIALTAIQNKITGIINCCSGVPMPLAEVVEEYIKANNLNIKLQYGKFPDRASDSPIVYGDSTKIELIKKAR